MNYNGWTNYETWNVKLWLDNEEPSYRYWNEAAAEAWADAPDDDHADSAAPWTVSETARFHLADRLKNEITEANPLGDQASTYSDLLGAALCEVNWDEIANAWLEDLDEDREPYEPETYVTN